MLKPSCLRLTLGFLLLGGFFLRAGLAWGARPEPPPAGGLTVTLALDKETYRPGETIQVTLQVANPTAEPVTLTFATSQRFDLAIEDERGQELWRWSRGRLFLQVLGEETIHPEGRPLTYDAEAPAPGEPGRYRLLGGLATKGRAPRATIPFTVR